MIAVLLFRFIEKIDGKSIILKHYIVQFAIEKKYL